MRTTRTRRVARACSSCCCRSICHSLYHRYMIAFKLVAVEVPILSGPSQQILLAAFSILLTWFWLRREPQTAVVFDVAYPEVRPPVMPFLSKYLGTVLPLLI